MGRKENHGKGQKLSAAGGRLHGLAETADGGLVAWVDGTERYATHVEMEKGQLPDAVCTCPYAIDCKHGVATVLEYLAHIQDNQPVSIAKPDDERLELLQEDDWEEADVRVPERTRQQVTDFLKGQTRTQLVSLVEELAGKHPEVAVELSDRQQMALGDVKTVVTRLRRKIHDLRDDIGWQEYWNDQGHTPDYGEVRKGLATLLAAGYADETLDLGKDLVAVGLGVVEVSRDNGETHMEVADCMPVVVEALDQSSLKGADKLEWALGAVLKDQFEVCEAFEAYLHRTHAPSVWETFADRLLGRLQKAGDTGGRTGDFSRRYHRDRLSGWAIHALEQAGQSDKIIELCIAEVEQTGNYTRLVKLLMQERRYQEAEEWILVGIRAIGKKELGTVSDLRGLLLEIRRIEKAWPVVAAIHVEEFVRSPSEQNFEICRKAGRKIKAWPGIRKALLQYLEAGDLPWLCEDWPLPASGLDRPGVEPRGEYPKISRLIEIAIFEKKPDQVLHWHDQQPEDQGGWYYYGVDSDRIATAVASYAPDRAVKMWQEKAERLIAQVKPKAYQQAVVFLRKAAKVVAQEEKGTEWNNYLKALRENHRRKWRLMEILDGLEQKPIVTRRR